MTATLVMVIALDHWNAGKRRYVAPATPLPASEQRVVMIVEQARTAFLASHSEPLRAERVHALCAGLSDPIGWVGTVENAFVGQGHVHLRVRIAPHLALTNDGVDMLSNVDDLGDARTAVGATMAGLVEGDQVVFSATLRRDNKDCVVQSRQPTLDAMEDPFFLVRFDVARRVP